MHFTVKKGCQPLHIKKGMVGKVLSVDKHEGSQALVRLQFSNKIGYNQKNNVISLLARYGSWVKPNNESNLNTGRPEHNIRLSFWNSLDDDVLQG